MRNTRTPKARTGESWERRQHRLYADRAKQARVKRYSCDMPYVTYCANSDAGVPASPDRGYAYEGCLVDQTCPECHNGDGGRISSGARLTPPSVL
jgi:hypothetical protein